MIPSVRPWHVKRQCPFCRSRRTYRGFIGVVKHIEEFHFRGRGRTEGELRCLLCNRRKPSYRQLVKHYRDEHAKKRRKKQ